jgi:hypothetical protein
VLTRLDAALGPGRACHMQSVRVQHQRLYEADGHVSVRVTPILPGALFDTQRGFHCVFIR